MTMINKEKVLKGVGKAVDAANNAADKAAAFAKEKELDKKAKNMAHTLEDGIYFCCFQVKLRWFICTIRFPFFC